MTEAITFKNTIIVLRETPRGSEKVIGYLDKRESRLREKLQKHINNYPRDIIRFALPISMKELIEGVNN